MMSMARLQTAEVSPVAGQRPVPFNSETMDFIWGICICSGCKVARVSWRVPVKRVMGLKLKMENFNFPFSLYDHF